MIIIILEIGILIITRNWIFFKHVYPFVSLEFHKFSENIYFYNIFWI
jgi:hypothetical protein